MNLELRHLKVVCAIAETGSVTKAASLLGLAQPALTAQLQRIERTLGGPLFERDRRGARPTALGELVLSRARVLLPAMKGLQDEAARLAGSGADENVMTRYRIGAIGGPVIGGMVHRLSEAQPEAQISTHASYYVDELATMVLVEQAGLRAGRRLRRRHPLRGLRPGVADHRRRRCLRADAREPPGGQGRRGRPRRDVRGAVGRRHRRRLLRRLLRGGLRAQRVHPRRMLETDIRGCVDMVESGLALALCQPTFRPPAGLTHRPLMGAPLRWRQVLGWHPDSQAAKVAPRLMGMAGEAYAEVVARNPLYIEWLEDYPQLGGGQLAAA
nr:hypothetical protein GCM10020092_043740 [Actinoplanes digitatis]